VHRGLSYSNVVATLALFVALGGTGYAAAKITSSDIKNRTIKGGDIRKNALGGTEVNEARLRQVPSALNADVANVASDANTLAGQGAAAFEKSTAVQFGAAPLTPASVGDERTLLSWPEMGVELKTSSVACAGDKIRLRVVKTQGPYTSVLERGDSHGSLVGGQNVTFCSSADDIWDGMLANETGLTLSFECVNVNNSELRCFGIRSE
jgi:hypothetical protein